MHKFEDYFSKNQIIEVLCKLRLNKAASIHEKRFFRRIVHYEKERPSPPFYAMFPARRSWNRFRPKKCRRKNGGDIVLETLIRSVRWHEKNSSDAPWLVLMLQKVEDIRLRALSGNYVFQEPSISPLHKSGDDYRAIASFRDVADKVVDILNARYLRDALDPVFESASVAFRSSKVVSLSRITSINKIADIRSRHAGSLFVAECDIRGFFDCVNHSVAKMALRRAVAHLKLRLPDMKMDKRAVGIFRSYLDSYSFSHSVKSKEYQLRLDTGNEHATYKWPDVNLSNGPYSLRFFYKNPFKVKLGIPQGGAHSCFIANLVLDVADKETALALHAGGGDSIYQRYCDDMIIVSDRKEVCASAFESYLRSLVYLKLPYHQPSILEEYNPDFYEVSKTKNTYEWSLPKDGSQSPWVQFLGYQIRCDGLIRVRPSSIVKHKEKLRALKERISKDVKTKSLKVTRRRVLYRFSSKAVAFSVGRINLRSPMSGPMPMCWCSGFKQLHGKRFVRHQIVGLDKEIGKNRRWLRQTLKGVTGGEKSAKLNKEKTYFGKPFSHIAQFQLR